MNGLYGISHSGIIWHNGKAGIGTSLPIGKLHVSMENVGNSLNVTPDEASVGLYLENPTPGNANKIQTSPSILFSGQGVFNSTNRTAECKMKQYLEPTTAGTHSMRWSSKSPTSATYTTIMTLSDNSGTGLLSVNTGSISIVNAATGIATNVLIVGAASLTISGYYFTNAGAQQGASGVLLEVKNSSASVGRFMFNADPANVSGVMFSLGNDTSVYVVRASIELSNAVNTGGSESADLIFKTQSGGTQASTKLTIASTGLVTIASGGLTITSGTITVTSGNLAMTAGNITLSAGNLQLAAGTLTVAPITFTSGTNLTTPVAGAMEYDGKIFYGDFAASQRGVNVTEQFIVLSSTYTLGNNGNEQKLFNVPANGALTVLADTTYYFTCQFALSSMGGTSGNIGFNILGAGGATLTSASWSCIGKDQTSVTPLALSGLFTNTASVAGPIVVASTATAMHVTITGIIRVAGGGGGTLIPSITLTNAAAAVVAVNSFIFLHPIGSSTVTNVGNWA